MWGGVSSISTRALRWGGLLQAEPNIAAKPLRRRVLLEPVRRFIWWDFLAYGEFVRGVGTRGCGGVRLVRRGSALWWFDPESAAARTCIFPSARGNTLRSRSLFLAGAPAPVFVRLLLPCL